MDMSIECSFDFRLVCRGVFMKANDFNIMTILKLELSTYRFQIEWRFFLFLSPFFAISYELIEELSNAKSRKPMANITFNQTVNISSIIHNDDQKFSLKCTYDVSVLQLFIQLVSGFDDI